MPGRRKAEIISCEHFVWRLGRRGRTYTADGRSNRLPAGRHSLGTSNRETALERLRELDLIKAVELGLASEDSLKREDTPALSLAEGRRLYEEHATRPRIAGGPKQQTADRYRPVLDKFIAFAVSQGIENWNPVQRRVLEKYAAWLDGEAYAYATEYLELTTLKQIIKWLVEEGHLPPECRIHMPLRKPEGTDTWCWSAEEVAAIVDHCTVREELEWLKRVVTALACTGLRISELASLRWTDIDVTRNVLVLKDEETRRRRRSQARTTKSGRDRSFPLHQDLRSVLSEIERHSDGLVFHGPRGGVLKPDTVRRILVRDVISVLSSRFPAVEGDIGFADGRLHSFRHYFCSTCANGGVPEQVVMRWLGHSSSKMVRHYYHLHDEESQRQMSRLDFIGRPGSRDAG